MRDGQRKRCQRYRWTGDTLERKTTTRLTTWIGDIRSYGTRLSFVVLAGLLSMLLLGAVGLA